MDRPVITMQGNTLTFVSGIRLSILRRKDNWGGGTTVTITPKAPAKVDNVSAASSDESKGTAGVMYKKGNTYGVLAKSAAGYAFDYWLRGNAEDTAANHLRENPYMVETTEAASFVAYFREPYHVTVRAEISSAGTQTAEYVNSKTVQISGDLFLQHLRMDMSLIIGLRMTPLSHQKIHIQQM